MQIPTHCTLCPAPAVRTAPGPGSLRRRTAGAPCPCGASFWEEPCISGTRGSGTVFFSGCPLKCCYCQNFTISAQNFGREVSTRTLADIFFACRNRGAQHQPGHCRALSALGVGSAESGRTGPDHSHRGTTPADTKPPKRCTR